MTANELQTGLTTIFGDDLDVQTICVWDTSVEFDLKGTYLYGPQLEALVKLLATTNIEIRVALDMGMGYMPNPTANLEIEAKVAWKLVDTGGH